MPGWCSSRNVFTGLEKACLFAGRRRPQKCVRARRQAPTTSTMFGYNRAASQPSSRCSATSPSEITSRSHAIELRVEPDHQGVCAAAGNGCWSRSISTTTRPSTSGKKIAGLPDSKIVRIAGLRQFLADGRYRPPAVRPSEIFFDHGPHIPGGPPRLARAGRATASIEIWNLVFMQFEQLAGGRAPWRCRSPRSTPAWGSSASPRCCRARTTTTGIDLFRAIIGAVADYNRRRRRRCKRCIAPRHPPITWRAFRLPDRRRRAALERGPRLRAAPESCAAPCAMPSCLGAKDPLMWRLVPVLCPRDGGRPIPNFFCAPTPLITETAQARGVAVSARRWRPRASRSLDEESPPALRSGDKLKGRTRLYAVRYLRLPARSDRRMRSSRAAIAVDTDGFSAAMERQAREPGAPASWTGSGEGPRPRPSGFRCARSLGATEFLGYETESARRRGRRACSRTARRSRTPRGWRERGPWSSTRRHSMAKSGGQVGDTGVMTGDGVRFSRVTETQKKGGDLFVHYGTVEEGRAGRSVRRCRSMSDHARRSAIRQKPTPRLTSCTRRCVRCWAITSRRRVRWSRRIVCGFDFSHPKADQRGRNSAASRTSPTTSWFAELSRHDAPDGAR